MMLSDSKENDLLYVPGLKIRGVTRAHFKSLHNTYSSSGIVIYTNRDYTYGSPEEIVKNIAFELENVAYSMKYPSTEYGQDSPFALQTQQAVCWELGIEGY